MPAASRSRCATGPIVNVLFRQPVKDVVIGDVTIPAGSVVALGYPSANHDESVFPNADEFDPGRGDALRRQLGFGWGIHLCVGAPLARGRGRRRVDAVLDRIPEMRLAPGSEYQRVKMFMMRGPTRVDVEIGCP